MEEITNTNTVTGPNKAHFRQANSEVTQRFVHDIEAGFNRYRYRYAATGYSRRRGKDVSDLRKILHNMPHETLLHCIDVLKARTQAIRTGFFIFQTGRSKLKKYTLKTLTDYSDPVVGTLLRKIAEYSQDSENLTLEQIIALAEQKDESTSNSRSQNDLTQSVKERLTYLEDERKRRKQERHACCKSRSSFFAAPEEDNSLTYPSQAEDKTLTGLSGTGDSQKKQVETSCEAPLPDPLSGAIVIEIGVGKSRRKQRPGPTHSWWSGFFATDEADDNSHTDDSPTGSWEDSYYGLRDDSSEEEEKPSIPINPHIFKFR